MWLWDTRSHGVASPAAMPGVGVGWSRAEAKSALQGCTVAGGPLGGDHDPPWRPFPVENCVSVLRIRKAFVERDADLERLDWPTAAGKGKKRGKATDGFAAALGPKGDGVVTLDPMQIRTALVYFA